MKSTQDLVAALRRAREAETKLAAIAELCRLAEEDAAVPALIPSIGLLKASDVRAILEGTS